jgi:hypothetical protein
MPSMAVKHLKHELERLVLACADMRTAGALRDLLVKRGAAHPKAVQLRRRHLGRTSFVRIL